MCPPTPSFLAPPKSECSRRKWLSICLAAAAVAVAVAFVCCRSFGAGAASHALFNPLMALVTKSGQQQQQRRFRQLWALRFWHSAKETPLPSLSALLIVIVILLPIELLSDGLAAVVCTCNLPQTATHYLTHTLIHQAIAVVVRNLPYSSANVVASLPRAGVRYLCSMHCTLSMVYTKYIY